MIDQVCILSSIEEPDDVYAIFKLEDGFVDVSSDDESYADEMYQYFTESKVWRDHVKSDNPFGNMFRSGYETTKIYPLPDGAQAYLDAVTNMAQSGEMYERTIAPLWEVDDEGSEERADSTDSETS